MHIQLLLSLGLLASTASAGSDLANATEAKIADTRAALALLQKSLPATEYSNSSKLDEFKGLADPAASVVTVAKLKAGLGSIQDNRVWEPSQIICYVDDTTGVVVGIDDGWGQRCGYGIGTPVPVKLDTGQYIRSVDVDVVPKSALVGRLTFLIDQLNVTTVGKAVLKAPFNASLVTCGRAPKSLLTGSLEAPKLEAALELADYAATLKAGGNATVRVGGLGWFNVKDCVNDRKTRVVANTTAGGKVAELAALVSKAPLNSSLDASKLKATFTYQTCRSSILCVPGSTVTADQMGCTAYDGSTFWFVLDSTIANTVPCPPLLTNSFGYAVQKVLPGEDPSCGLTASCQTPPITPEPRSPTDTPTQAILDGGACQVNGAFAPCSATCDPGLVPVPDQGGTCPPGAACCVSPPATCPTGTTLCGNACSNLLTDKLNCGKCGNDCTIGVLDPTQASCQKGVCTCTADGVSNPYNKVKAVATSPTAPGGIPCQYQTQSIQSFNLGTPATIGGIGGIGQCTLIYNSFNIPDRFVVRSGSPCGPLVADTSYTGGWKAGCGSGLTPGGSGPCCPADPKTPQCLGANPPSPYCPRTSPLGPNQVQTNTNGFLPGAGKLTFPVNPNDPLYLSAFGQCGGTGNAFAMVCCTTASLSGGHCPGTGTPGQNLLYVPNGTGCVVKNNQIVSGNTAADTACNQCTLN